VAVAGSGVGLALVQRKLRGGASDLSPIFDSESDPVRRPPLLMFIYSDTCGACLVAQRMMDGIERELAGRATVVRLNVADHAGAEAQERFQTTKVPAIILMDDDGVQRYRTEGRLPRRQAILDEVDRSQ
jgi:thiol-disulfide isomerase/thioredoxin